MYVRTHTWASKSVVTEACDSHEIAIADCIDWAGIKIASEWRSKKKKKNGNLNLVYVKDIHEAQVKIQQHIQWRI